MTGAVRFIVITLNRAHTSQKTEEQQVWLTSVYAAHRSVPWVAHQLSGILVHDESGSAQE